MAPFNSNDQEILKESKNRKLNNTSKDFRILFLLSFTKELIKDYKISEMSKLENIIKNKILPPPKKRDEFKMLEKEYEDMIPSILYREPATIQKQVSKPAPLIVPSMNYNPPTITYKKPAKKMYERIQDIPLPPTVQNIKPTPTEIQIDLGKLNALAVNPEVLVIECNGPDEPLVIKSAKGSRIINTSLKKEEISSIIQRFSDATRIPVSEGVFKVAAGRFIISAIVSDILGSKFIIKKMTPQNQPMPVRMMPRY